MDEVEKRFSDKPLEYHYAAILAVELYAIEKKSVFRELYYEAYTKPCSIRIWISQITTSQRQTVWAI